MKGKCPYTSDGKHVHFPDKYGKKSRKVCSICKANEDFQKSKGILATEKVIQRAMKIGARFDGNGSFNLPPS